MSEYIIRKAKLNDVTAISNLTRKNSRVMLFRSPEKIKRMLSDFFVAFSEKDGVVGCCGLKTYPGGDAEIISLAVDPEYQGKNIGDKLIKQAVRSASGQKSVKRILALTTRPVSRLFRRNNFRDAGIQFFHEKILRDCRNCPRNKIDKRGKYLCNEIALLYTGENTSRR